MCNPQKMLAISEYFRCTCLLSQLWWNLPPNLKIQNVDKVEICQVGKSVITGIGYQWPFYLPCDSRRLFAISSCHWHPSFWYNVYTRWEKYWCTKILWTVWQTDIIGSLEILPGKYFSVRDGFVNNLNTHVSCNNFRRGY